MNEHTLTQLRDLRLDGMVRAIEDQATSTAATALGFDERLSLLVQAEVAWRDDRRLQRLLKAARLKVSTACVEDIQWRASRALDRELVASLAGGPGSAHWSPPHPASPTNSGPASGPSSQASARPTTSSGPPGDVSHPGAVP